jgi:hypothetical protein
MGMKRTNEWFLFGGMVLIVFLVVGAVAFQMVSERNRDAALSKFTARSAIERYESKLAEPLKSTAQPQTNAETVSATNAEQSKPLKTSEESIAAYASLFVKIDEMQNQERWRDGEKLFNEKSLDKWTQEDWAFAKSLMDDAKEFILEIRRLAEWGGPAYALDFSKGENMELPHLSKLRNFARLLRDDAYVQGHDGNIGEVCDDVISVMKLANSLKGEPCIISQLVRYAIVNIAYDMTCNVLPPSGTPSDVARKIIDYSEECLKNSRESLAESILTDGNMGMGEFEDIRTGKATSDADDMNNYRKIGLWIYGSMAARPFLDMDESAYMNFIQRIAEYMKLPLIEAKPLLNGVEKEIRELPRTCVISREMIPALLNTINSEGANETKIHLIQVGLAIEQYHDRTKIYPMSLEEAAPDYGNRPAIDPFSNKPLVYRIVKDGFLLYSISENCIDDDGIQDFKDGDIVWRGVKPEK